MNEDWKRFAACRGMDGNLFYPHSGQVDPQAVEACARCPVAEDCYQHALRFEDRGYWGGTTAQQRERLREAFGIKLERTEYRSLPLEACGTAAGYRRHLRRHEEPCGACKDAAARAKQPGNQAYRARNSEAKSNQA